MTQDSNASASSFGWDFQSNAAVILMLDNIKEVDSVRVEGATEDIEINLSNGKTIYSQAKSAVRSDDSSNAISKLKAGLKTLNEASKKSNVEKLTYITNLIDPFNDVKTLPFFNGMTRLTFSQLPESCKCQMRNIITDCNYSNISEQQIEVYVLPFHGDGTNRYKMIKQAVYEFLDLIGINDSGLGQKIIDIWQNLFFHNSSQQDLEINLTKKGLIWPIIVSICEVGKDETFFNDYDDCEIDEIYNKYQSVINNNSECFEFTTKVIYDFSNYYDDIPKEKIRNFIDKSWRVYQNEFDILGVDDSIKEAIIKLILHKILLKRKRVSSIKEVINL